MNKNFRTVLILILVAGLGAMAASVTPSALQAASGAQAAQASNVAVSPAALTVTAAQLTWQPQADYVRDQSRFLLIVGSGDFNLRQWFEAGNAPLLNLRTAQGKRLPDGLYGYTLTAFPTGRLASLKSTSISGFFSIRDGAFVIPQSEAGQGGPGTDAAQAPDSPDQPDDQVIPDDLIVQSSICVGYDCINGESFGFDTIRLKENNTRIGFMDTSVGTFPTNDWQIVANDSASGGASYLGFLDVTNGPLSFLVMAGAPTNALVVSGAGIGLGTNLPQAALHLATSNAAANLSVRFDNQANAVQWEVSLAPDGTMQFNKVGAIKPAFKLDGNGNLFITGALAQGSDVNSKQNFSAVDRQALMQKLSDLPITSWSYQNDNDVRHIGPTAQDFYAAFGLGANDTSISPMDASSIALAAAQELSQADTAQKAQISELEQTNQQLNERLADLETRLAALEAGRGMASASPWGGLLGFLAGMTLAGVIVSAVRKHWISLPRWAQFNRPVAGSVGESGHE